MSGDASNSSSGPRILAVRLGAMGDVLHALRVVQERVVDRRVEDHRRRTVDDDVDPVGQRLWQP